MKCKLTNLFAAGGAGALLLGLLAAGPADAAPNTGSMQVSATVAGACTISAPPIAFGVLTLTGGDTTQQLETADVTYSCNTVPTAFTVGTGLNDPATPVTGYGYAMANGANLITYGLDVIDGGTFSTADAAIPLTPSSPNNVVGGAVPSAVTGGAEIAAQIPSGQATVAGTYDDTVTFQTTF